jgi:hypothetical protein
MVLARRRLGEVLVADQFGAACRARHGLEVVLVDWRHDQEAVGRLNRAVERPAAVVFQLHTAVTRASLGF